MLYLLKFNKWLLRRQNVNVSNGLILKEKVATSKFYEFKNTLHMVEYSYKDILAFPILIAEDLEQKKLSL